MTPRVEQFAIEASDSELDDLRRRLRSTRWAADPHNDDWRYGTSRAYLAPLVQYWIDEYDWRAQEARMNRFEHYRVELDGVPVHFLYRRGAGPAPVPLLLTHGWPWTFWDFADMIEPLADPEAWGGQAGDDFDVVIPSLPGFGYSSPLTVPGIGVAATARLWRRLMREVLGYERFAALGGDFGAVVTQRMAQDFPADLIGVHLSRYRRPAGAAGVGVSVAGPQDYGPDEAGDHERDRAGAALVASHLAVHSHDPQTLAFALSDSPVGLASWLLERRRNWSQCGGDLESVYSRDDLLTGVMIYWLTGTIGSSMRYYWESAREDAPPPENSRIEVPLAIGVLPGDVSALPRLHAEQDTDLRRWTRYPRGGHFGPAEVPELIVADLREFFRALR
ncbi:epoxide hydrolase family protein [Prauserella cavernicola]|uniref:Alpha/beta fold hydrolase n=1 Tax=Prauserella cavernicola TaxID=2800127 RepID=A0A934QXJ4_9PSEU|nr:epoxide hydrolase family protein [Prauserella cavernicola]MBK1787124.1 alpha/beta fold hydrolase [Prauserella cavernicola]